MRHSFLLSGPLILAVSPLPVRMVEPAFVTLLVSSARFSERLSSGPRRTGRGAIAMAVVTRTAQEENLATIPKYANHKAKRKHVPAAGDTWTRSERHAKASPSQARPV